MITNTRTRDSRTDELCPLDCYWPDLCCLVKGIVPERALCKPGSKAVWKDVLARRQLNGNVRHLVTSSKDHRENTDDLWEISLLDLLIRHGSANHTQETIAWSNRRQKMAERLVIFLVHRNSMKGRRAKEGARGPPPAMARGMFDHRVTPEDLFKKRPLGCVEGESNNLGSTTCHFTRVMRRVSM